jgi:hypothetical protein
MDPLHPRRTRLRANVVQFCMLAAGVGYPERPGAEGAVVEVRVAHSELRIGV